MPPARPIAIHPHNPAVMFVGTQRGVYRLDRVPPTEVGDERDAPRLCIGTSLLCLWAEQTRYMAFRTSYADAGLARADALCQVTAAH